MIFSKNTETEFSISTKLLTLSEGHLPPKKGTFENLGARAPSAPPFLRHWTVTPPENKLSENEKIVVDFYIFRLRKFHSPWASVDTYFWKIYNDAQQIVPWIPEPSTVNNKLKCREGSGSTGRFFD